MKIAETPCGTKLSQRLLLVRCLIVLCLLLLLLVYKYVKIGKIISSKMLQTKNGGWVLNSVCHLRLKGTKVYSCATSIIWLHVSEDHIYSTDLSTFIVRRMSLDWQACVSPVYDKGYKQLPENYMPVFLTCTCSKIMEQFLFQIIIFRHLESHHILNDFKHCCWQFQSSEIKLTGFEFINVAKDLQNIYDRRTWCVSHRFLKSSDNCTSWRRCVYHIKNVSWIQFYTVRRRY